MPFHRSDSTPAEGALVAVFRLDHRVSRLDILFRFDNRVARFDYRVARFDYRVAGLDDFRRDGETGDGCRSPPRPCIPPSAVIVPVWSMPIGKARSVYPGIVDPSMMPDIPIGELDMGG